MKKLAQGKKAQLVIAFSSGNLEVITFSVWKIPQLRCMCISLFLRDIDAQCQLLRTKFDGSNAQLCSKEIQSLVNFNWNDMVHELANIAPDLINVIITAVVPTKREQSNKYNAGIRRIASIRMGLAIILHEWSTKLNALQQILSLLMVNGGCSKRTNFQRLSAAAGGSCISCCW